jgi:hypothetical protein
MKKLSAEPNETLNLEIMDAHPIETETFNWQYYAGRIGQLKVPCHPETYLNVP